MAISGCIKVLLGVGTVFFGVGSLASLKDLRHASAPVWMQKLRMLLGGRFEDSEYDQSACHACLASGKDFCIAGNRCIERATYQCQGPYDHITGDKEFALHGNPFTEHSMECPAPTHDPDCYFDKDCHAKVDWNKVKKIKGGFFARLKIMKEKKDVNAVKEMWGRVHKMLLEAGMPDDRIDYILKKWVKSVYPDFLSVDDKKHTPDGKDCYFDKDCHAKVDWAQVKKIKGGFFARLKIMKEKKDVKAVKEMWGRVHKMFLEAGMPDDRIDYILEKWVKTVYPDFFTHGDEKHAPDSKDCYLDKECHAKVDWDQIERIKGGFIARLKIMKEKKDVKAVRVMLGRVHNVFLKAGMPDDRIDDFLKKWVTSVYPEAFPVDDKNNAPDSKDCFFDEECHSKVDWDYVTEIKGGFLSRLKIMKEKRDVNDAKEMLGTVRKMCLEAGMPDDRIDYILTKWAKSILPDVLPLDSNIKSPDRKDCYFDKDCHAKVDWGSVSKVKRGFFKRLKYMKGQKRVRYAKHMLSKVHGLLVGAGMPDDRINYTIDEWMKYACPEAWDGLAEKRVETSSSPSIVV